MDKIKEYLKKFFHIDNFRFNQEEIIKAVLDKKNCVVIMPTGGGKSLCFQLPAMYFEGVTMVVSPLIALMKDQVDALNRNGVPATFINSSISGDEQTQRINDVRAGKYKLLYIAPERFNNFLFKEQLQGLKVDLFAIDEAHCISDWGHDFRPSYLRLKEVIKFLNNPPVIALTATATPEVKKDIIKQLDLESPEIFVAGFDRPNLSFSVITCGKSDKAWQTLEFVKTAPGSGIIYAGTRSNADQITAMLQESDIEAINYHAGLMPEERKKIQDDFMNNKYRVIVATNAFGMGIDKPDIRFVIHFDIPGSLEAYYQEAGRAGRDGQGSHCLLFYNTSDRYLREFFIKGDNPSRQNIEEIYSVLKQQSIEPILLTYNEISGYLSENVPEMAIGTGLKLLERYGYITMAKENEKEAFIKFNLDFAQILENVGERAKTKLEVIEFLINRYKEDLVKGVNFSMEKDLADSPIGKDSFIRALRALKKEELIDYEPPFKGKEIYVNKKVDQADLEIDWKSLDNKLRRDMDKLDLMEGYVYTKDCRRRYILDYFGERESKNFCGNCDNC